jgi:hypothetical protein
VRGANCEKRRVELRERFTLMERFDHEMKKKRKKWVPAMG